MKLLLSLILLSSAPAWAVEGDAILIHIRKRFNIPKEVGMKFEDAGPSKIGGWKQGVVELISPRGASKQSVLISNDGRYYFMTPIFAAAGDAGVPGLRRFESGDGAPPLFASQDGKFILPGAFGAKPEDLTVDPDKENLSKLNLNRGVDRGPKNAPVILVDFSDLQCPTCKTLHEEMEAKLRAKYGKKVRWISKHYPLNIHPAAAPAAAAVVCAGRKSVEAAGKMQDLIFKDQAALSPETVKATTSGFAKQLGLAEKDFAACLDSKEAQAEVAADQAEGDSVGVNSTPTFFINGRKVHAANFDQLSAAIDEFLK